MTAPKVARMFLPLAAAALSSCVAPSMPPHLTFSRHVSPSSDEADARLGVSTGGAYVSTEGDNLLALFPTEAFVSFFGDRYSGSVAAGHFLGSYEGNLLLVNGEGARVGVLHGLGLGYTRSSSDDPYTETSSTLFYDLSAGLMVELQPGQETSPFLGFRYTFADASESPDQGDYVQTDYYSFGAGVRFQVGDLEVTPEVVYSRASWDEPGFFPGDPDETFHANYFVPGASVSVPF